MGRERDGYRFENLSELRNLLRSSGTVVLPCGFFVADELLPQLIDLVSGVSEERVAAGADRRDHDVFVRRIINDPPGDFPKSPIPEIASAVMSIVHSERQREILKGLVGPYAAPVVRRCQVNLMRSGSRIAIHSDQGANPDYTFSISIQLSTSFSGGEFVSYSPDRVAKKYCPSYGETLITNCARSHEVLPVKVGERLSLVLFYARNAGRNAR